MRRLLFFLCGVLVCLSGALPARAGSDMPAQVNDGKPVSLVVFGLPSITNATAVGAKADMAVASEFMRRYPNVALKPFSFVKVPGAGMEGGSSIDTDTNTLMAMAAGIAPDVFTTNFRQSDTFIRQGFLLPLDTQVTDWEKNSPEEFNNAFPYPVLKEVAYRYGPDGQQHWYAIPPDTLSMVMMYRKDLLSAAGVDASKPPETWDEFYEMCIKVTDPRKQVYGYTLQGSWFLSWMLWSMGNKVIDTKDNVDWYADYNSNAPDNNSVEAFKFAWKLVKGPWAICPECDEHYVLPAEASLPAKRAGITASCPNGHKHTVADLEKKFKLFFEGVCTRDFNLWGQGKLACMISYMGNMVLNTPGVDPSLIQLARVPKSPLGLSVSEINAKMYAINGTLKDPGKIETAWAYIRFQCSDEAKKIKTKVFVDNGYAKYLNPAWLRKFGYEAYLREVPPQWERMFNDALREGRPEPYGKNAQQIYNEMDVAWGEVQEQVKVLDAAGEKKIKAILDRNVQLTNEKLMGKIPEPVKKKRDSVALIVVLVSACLFFLLGRYTMATYGKALQSDAQRSRAALRQVLMAWLIMVPALGAVMLFQYFPLVRGSTIAFQDYQILLTQQKWIGLSNFGAVLFTPAFWNALANTAKFAALSLGLGFLAPVILALLLHEIPRASLFFRIVFYLPAVTSGVVVMLLWMQLYDPSPYGALNQMLSVASVSVGVLVSIWNWGLSLGPLLIGVKFVLYLLLLWRAVLYIKESASPAGRAVVAVVMLALLYPALSGPIDYTGIPTQKFLTDSSMAMLWVIIPSIWMGIGPGCIIYLAALRQIPTDYYEAADVDGAGFFAKLRTITVPYLKPLLIINFVGACVAAMKSFEQILIMTGGGPAGSTKVLGLELWQNAFMYLRYGHATAMGWILASLLIGFTMFQLRYLSKVQFRLAKSD